MEEEGGKQDGSRETNEANPDRMLLQASRATCVGGREGGKEGRVSHPHIPVALLAPSLPPSLPDSSLPPSLLPSLRTFAFKHHARAGPFNCMLDVGRGCWGGQRQTVRMHDPPSTEGSTEPRLVLLLGRPPLFSKHDGRAGRKEEHNDKSEATHTQGRKRGGGGGGSSPSTEW